MLIISRRSATPHPPNENSKELGEALLTRPKLMLSFLLLPSTICYLASDILNFFLFTRISATAFSVVKQSRIVITALLFRFVLKRSVSVIQWLAVFQLALASTLFVAADMIGQSMTQGTSDASVAEHAAFMFGIALLLFKCFLDSLAVVWMDYFFKKLDDSGFPYAEQQLYVSVQSVIGGLIYFFAVDYEGGRSLFDGYTPGGKLLILRDEEEDGRKNSILFLFIHFIHLLIHFYFSLGFSCTGWILWNSCFPDSSVD
jgi:drug/metabolite transporter (DMT)-like permease